MPKQATKAADSAFYKARMGFILALTGGIPAWHPAYQEMCDALSIEPTSEMAQKLQKGLGYKVQHRTLKSCDYGAPTTRTRFYLIARCDGRPIVWAEPTHAPKDSEAVKLGLKLPYRTAAECIDWSIPAQSIFERKKPLAENTMRRIARGIQKFVIDNPEPFIVTVNHSGEGFRGQSTDEPLGTITAKNGFWCKEQIDEFGDRRVTASEITVVSRDRFGKRKLPRNFCPVCGRQLEEELKDETETL